jgi:hypothetical protein
MKWDAPPPWKPAQYTEKECSKAVRELLGPYCDDLYSTESGTLWQSDGKPRAGGTRTTPGIPDLFLYLHDPVVLCLTVEAKGHSTAMRPEQWVFAMQRMQRGEPHLVVRSPQALLNGLRMLGLLPRELFLAPPVQPDPRSLPDNLLFLERTRELMWPRLAPFWEPPLHAIPYRPEPHGRRKWVHPTHVPAIVAEDAAARKAARLAKRAAKKAAGSGGRLREKTRRR